VLPSPLVQGDFVFVSLKENKETRGNSCLWGCNSQGIASQAHTHHTGWSSTHPVAAGSTKYRQKLSEFRTRDFSLTGDQVFDLCSLKTGRTAGSI